MSSRKRIISSCIPCYTRKQKCNREYPCNHCSRRQCTEGCVYYPAGNLNSRTASQSPGPATLPEHLADERSRDSLLAKVADSEPLNAQHGRHHEWHFETKLAIPVAPPSRLSLAESFGYLEHSSRNSLALARKLGLRVCNASPNSLASDAAKEVHRNTERMPGPKILDFLVEYFIAEVNWMEQCVYVPWFLAKYQRWRAAEERTVLVADVDFTILVLRMCSYASSFLPSPAYTLDTIHGVQLSDIRSMCKEAADNLEAISATGDSRGSAVRVQHLSLLGLQYQVEGKIKAFWEVLSRAVRVAQDTGMDCVGPASTSKGSENPDVGNEMESRTFCNLYIWDSLLSRQLDRTPFLQGPLPSAIRSRLHHHHHHHHHHHPLENRRESMVSDDARGSGILDAPDPFTERLLQADLADFWRRTSPAQTHANYDMVAAEDHDEKFYREFVLQLPPTFAITEPDTTWDGRFPKLPLQRKLLHMAIWDSICWNLRPLLLRQPQLLPAYKSVMLCCQKRKIAAAALHSLEAATHLHVLLGSCHTRAAAIISSTFEAAVIFVYLVTDPVLHDHQRQQQKHPHQQQQQQQQQQQALSPIALEEPDPLEARMGRVTHTACAAAIKAALRRLQMLAEASNLAEVAANVLSQLLKVNNHALGSHFFGPSEIAMVQGGRSFSGPSLLTESETDPIRTTHGARGVVTPTTSATMNRDNIALIHSEMAAISTMNGEMASWPHGSPADLGLVDDLIPSSPTVAGGDILDWTSFEASIMNAQEADVWVGYRRDGPHPEWKFSLSGT